MLLRVEGYEKAEDAEDIWLQERRRIGKYGMEEGNRESG